MPRDKKQQIEEPPPGVPTWMVTFSDCMTLLLTFFVLLLTFSSFEAEERKQFSGAFKYIANYSIFPTKHQVKDSAFAPIDRPVDRTEEGSEKPTEEPLESIRYPHRPLEIIDNDAYRPQKRIYIPSGSLFWGGGATLSAEGRKKLGMIASLMKEIPCHVIVSESRLSEAPTSGTGPTDMSLWRAQAVVKYLTRDEGVSPQWFSVSSTDSHAATRCGGKAAVQITLLAKGLY